MDRHRDAIRSLGGMDKEEWTGTATPSVPWSADHAPICNPFVTKRFGSSNSARRSADPLLVIQGVRSVKRFLRRPVRSWVSSKPFTESDLAPRSAGKENHLKM
jgi:hypothetical protein